MERGSRAGCVEGKRVGTAWTAPWRARCGPATAAHEKRTSSVDEKARLLKLVPSMLAGLAVPMYPTRGEQPFATLKVEKPCEARYFITSFSPLGMFSLAPRTSATAANGRTCEVTAAAVVCSTLRLHSPSPRGVDGRLSASAATERVSIMRSRRGMRSCLDLAQNAARVQLTETFECISTGCLKGASPRVAPL